MTAAPYVNHGRWVVDCPHEYCTWAYLAVDDHGLRTRFVCNGGQGARGCGTNVEVAWPPIDVCQEVEHLLRVRPKMNRNWRPPETTETLEHENRMLLVGWTLRDLAEAV